MVAVHGVADRIARNENVAIQVRHRPIRNHKSVAVLVQYQPSSQRIAGSTRALAQPRSALPAFMLPPPAAFYAPGAFVWPLTPPAGPNKSPTRKFLYRLFFL
jgi:hypothetical protein